MENSKNYAVIMAGGIGSRFWPFSRKNLPKQFQDVLGVGQTLIQLTIERLARFVPRENIYVVTNRAYYDLVKSQAPFMSDAQILLEPQGRNTAPCVAYACQKIEKQNPDARVIVAPSDHIILKEDEFVRKAQVGLEAAGNKDVLITMGIAPSRPDTGYGYIQYVPEANDELKKVKTFTEKPHLELAKTFIESGDFVWNAGIFIWSVKALRNAMAKLLPDMLDLFSEGHEAYFTDGEAAFIENAYAQCTNISIDYGIMEKAENVFTILSDIGWSDLGTWKSLYEMKDKNNEANVTEGNVMLYDTEGCIIKGQKDRLIVVQGLKDYIIAQFDNATMICHRDQEQMVRTFVTDARNHKGDKFV